MRVYFAAIKKDKNLESQRKITMTLRKSLLATSILAATLGLTACGGSSSDDKTDPTPTQPTNQAPTDISLTASEAGVKENVALAQVAGTLSATDADSDTFTFTLPESETRFVIEGNTLSVKEGTVFDFEQTETVEVNVTVSDGEATFEKAISVAITDSMDYDFLNADSGESNVYYSGQIARHILIKELSNYIKSNDFVAHRAEGTDEISKFYDISDEDYENVWGVRPLTISAVDEKATQQLLTDVSGSHKNLLGKLAGEDAKGQYRVWNENDSLVGWAGLSAENNTPKGLAAQLFEDLRSNAAAVEAGTALTAHGVEMNKSYITPAGVDMQQMIEKYLFGAVAFSQGTSDYLGDIVDGKGLNSDHVATDVDEKGYTKLEHQWDEGYGYYGAARNFLDYSDNEIAGKVEDDESNGRLAYNGRQDTNNDGKINLLSEHNWGNSSNAAKRDRSPETTDLTKEGFVAFFEGRKLLNETAGTALTTEQKATLKTHAETASVAWEKAIVATVIHYINDVLDNSKGDIDDISSTDYTIEQFNAFAKHWAEMKGYALNMQFNPYSPFVDLETKKTTAAFAELHTLMGNAPIIKDIDGGKTVADYKADLVKARDILRDAYEWKNAAGEKLEGEALQALMEAW